MVKLNFKTAPPLSTQAETSSPQEEKKPAPPDIHTISAGLLDETKSREKPEEREQPNRRENLDLTFDSTESFFPKADEEETKTEEDKEVFVTETEKPRQGRIKKIADYSFEPEEDSFSGTISHKKLYLIFGGLSVVLIIVIFVVLQFLKPGEESTTVPKPQVPQQTAAANSPVNQALLPVYQANAASNQFIDRQLREFIAKKPNSANYSLIVMTPNEIDLTVLADSRDQIAQFHLDLKKAFPNFGFSIVSVQSRVSDGKQMIYADLSAKISSAQTSTTGTEVGTVKPHNIGEELRSLAQKNNLKLQYFKEGKVIDHSSYLETLYYANINGKKENILAFLNDLSQSDPAIRINKFSIFPYNLETISNKNLSTRLSFSDYNSK